MEQLNLELEYYYVSQVIEIIEKYYDGKIIKTPEQVRYFFNQLPADSEYFTQGPERSPMKIKPSGVLYYLERLRFDFDKIEKGTE